MKFFSLVALFLWAGVFPTQAVSTPTPEDLLARPGSRFHSPATPFWREIADLDERGLLIEQLTQWERALEGEPNSVEGLWRVLAGRLYFSAQWEGGDSDEDHPLPLWMRIRREGEEIEAAVSVNGTQWKRIARERLVLGKRAWFGVFVYTFRHPLDRLRMDHISLEGAIRGPWMQYSPKGQEPSPVEIKDGRLDLRTVGRGSPAWGWFAGVPLEGDGQLTVRMAGFESPDLQGEVGLAVRSAPTADASLLQMTDTHSGTLRYFFRRVPAGTAGLWQRLIDLAPTDARYRLGLARATRNDGFRWTAADQYLAAIQVDPATAFELAEPDPDSGDSNEAVSCVAAAKKFDALVPYVDGLRVEDFKDPKRYANLHRAMAVSAVLRNRQDVVPRYLERAIAADPEIATDPTVRFTFVQNAVRRGDPAELRRVMAQTFALPEADGNASPEARAKRRAELNEHYHHYGSPEVPTYPHAPASEYLLLLRKFGLLTEVGAALLKEPARYGAAREWDYVRLAVCAAAELPGILPDIAEFRRELPREVRATDSLFPGPWIAPSLSRWALRPGAIEWIGQMREADARRPKRARDPKAAMFLCASDFYAWPETRGAAMDWLQAYAGERLRSLDDRVEALATLMDYQHWNGSPDLAARAGREAAGLMIRQVEERGELDDFSREEFRRLVTAMAQGGLAAEVNRLSELMQGRFSRVGLSSAERLRLAANFSTSPDPGVVAVWPASSGKQPALHFAIEATPPPSEKRRPEDVRSTLGRIGAANEGRPRVVEFQGSSDGREWRPLGKVSTTSLTGRWSGELPAADRYFRAFVPPAAAKSAAVVRLPAGANLLPAVAVRPRSSEEGGGAALAGWRLPAFSTVYLQPSEVGGESPMVTWVGVDRWKMQVLAADPVPVDPRLGYQLSGWLRTSDTGKGTPAFGLSFRDARGKEIGSVAPVILRIPTWQYPQVFFGPGTEHPFPPETTSVAVIVKASRRVDFSDLSFCAD